MKPICFPRQKRGVTMIEVLIATLLIGISVAALVQFWYFSFRMTTQAANQSVAYSIARSAIEQVRQTGFDNTAEGSSRAYYDANGTFPPSTTLAASSIYSVNTSVVSDKFQGSAPAPDALRTVTVTVSLNVTGQNLYQMTTALSKAGL